MKYSVYLCSVVCAAIAVLCLYAPVLYTPVFPVNKAASSAILITGCSSGIGKHLAVDLAHEGYMVFATVRKDADLHSFPSSTLLHPLRMDVTDVTSIATAHRSIAALLHTSNRSLIGLVNNAGVAHIAPVEHIDLQKMREVLEVNLIGVVAVTQTFIPLLRETPGSRIINIGSMAGFFAPLFYGAYSASKFALEGLSDCLRAELTPQHIAVSLIQAGVIKDTKIREKNSGPNSVLASLPADARIRYGYSTISTSASSSSSSSSTSRAASIEATGDPPQLVTAAVLHALQSSQPQARYYAGRARVIPGWFLKMLSVLVPDSLLDRYLRVPPKA